MVLGIGIGAFGYAIFYWGVHHFPGWDGGTRYPLLQLLGIPSSWNVPVFKGIGLTSGAQSITNAITGAQLASNTTTANGLTGGSGDWISGILSSLGAPSSTNNVNKLNAWNACEGNLAGHSGLGINNPFNTTLDFGGGTSVNRAGVKSYPTMTVGIQATVQTMQSSRYAAIVSNLVNDGSFSAFAAAVGSSGWGTSGSCIAGKSVPVTSA